MSTPENDEWIVRLKSDGDVRNKAIEELRTILVRGLTAVCRERYDNCLQPEDVVQEALLTILKKLDTFEGRSKFTTWAMTISVRLAISEMRRRHFKDVSIESLTRDGMTFDIAQTEEATGDESEKAAILIQLKSLIENELTTKQRDAVQSLLNGMPVEVFAEKTGSNRNAVYKLVHDARAKLLKGFEASGFKAADFYSVFA